MYKREVRRASISRQVGRYTNRQVNAPVPILFVDMSIFIPLVTEPD